MTNQGAKTFPVNIQVQTISNCSGVFISHSNVIYGWSSHSKHNSGFGSIGSSNRVHNNVSIVFDSDFLDTVIDDRDTHTFIQNRRKEPSNQYIGFDKITVNAMQQNSGVFVGQTNLNGLDQHQKANTAYGSTQGHANLSMGNLNAVYDPDLIDGVINDQDNKPGIFINS